MTLADQPCYRRSRYDRQLLALRMLVLGQEGVPATRRLTTEVQDTTNGIVAEVEAMSRAVLMAGRGEPGAETFLWVRVARLAMAADQAVDAARRGDVPGLRAHLHHFDTLTSAIWTVQQAMHSAEPVPERPLPEPQARHRRTPPRPDPRPRPRLPGNPQATRT
jgi:hypothetical protein